MKKVAWLVSILLMPWTIPCSAARRPSASSASGKHAEQKPSVAPVQAKSTGARVLETAGWLATKAVGAWQAVMPVAIGGKPAEQSRKSSVSSTRSGRTRSLSDFDGAASPRGSFVVENPLPAAHQRALARERVGSAAGSAPVDVAPRSQVSATNSLSPSVVGKNGWRVYEEYGGMSYLDPQETLDNLAKHQLPRDSSERSEYQKAVEEVTEGIAREPDEWFHVLPLLITAQRRLIEGGVATSQEQASKLQAIYDQTAAFYSDKNLPPTAQMSQNLEALKALLATRPMGVLEKLGRNLSAVSKPGKENQERLRAKNRVLRALQTFKRWLADSFKASQVVTNKENDWVLYRFSEFWESSKYAAAQPAALQELEKRASTLRVREAKNNVIEWLRATAKDKSESRLAKIKAQLTGAQQALREHSESLQALRDVALVSDTYSPAQADVAAAYYRAAQRGAQAHVDALQEALRKLTQRPLKQRLLLRN